MPLVLQKDLTQMTRADFEEHLEESRARRLAAATILAASRQARLDHETETMQKRVENAQDMLGKAIERMEKAEQQVEDRLAKLEIYHQELGILLEYD